MTRVVGVRWQDSDPVSYASAGDFTLPLNSYVVVQLEEPQELARVYREASELVVSQPDAEPSIRRSHQEPAV